MSSEILNMSVTDSNVIGTFSVPVLLVKLKNIGTYSCYFNLNDTATTSNFKLDPEDEIEIGLNNITTVQAICDSTETTIIQVIGSDKW